MMMFTPYPDQKPIEGQTPPSLEALMERAFILLANNYQLDDPRYSASCAAIAFDIASSLLEYGLAPTIAVFTGAEINQRGIVTREPLKPTRYKGRVEFGAHMACLCEGNVYDPMVSQLPVPLEEYSASAFLNTVINVDPEYLSTEYIRSRLR